MIGLVIAAQLILGVAPINQPCQTDRRPVCAALMAQAFKRVDPVTGNAVRVIRGVAYDAIAIDVVTFPERQALIVQFNARDSAAHVEPGRFSAYYFPTALAPVTSGSPVEIVRDFLQTGSSGNGGAAAMTKLDDGSAALLVDAGGTWAGDTCSWVSLYAIDPDKPRELLFGELSFADTARLKIAARLVGPISRRALTFAYRRADANSETIVRFAAHAGALARVAGPHFQAC